MEDIDAKNAKEKRKLSAKTASHWRKLQVIDHHRPEKWKTSTSKMQAIDQTMKLTYQIDARHQPKKIQVIEQKMQVIDQ